MATPEEALARKKRVRAAHRASATRLASQFEALIGDPISNADELALLQTSLSSKLTTLATFDTEIVEITPEEQLEEEIGGADECAERIRRTMLKINKALKATPVTATPPGSPSALRRTATPLDETHSDPGHAASSAIDMDTHSRDATSPDHHHDHDEPVPPGTPATETRPTATSSKVKLPKITLPHFKGNPVYWTAFWDSYESAIHLNDALSDVDKFNYLRSLLERSAYDAIAGLTLSASNYREAVEILRKRFGNKQLIVSRHMETLLNLTAVSADNDLRGLRRLYNEVEANVRSLKALGVDQASYGTMLTSVLLVKLPPEIRLIVTRKASGEDLTFETLQTVWEEELVARERSRDPARNHRTIHDKPRLPATATTLLSGAPESSRGSSSCCYCQQSHSAADCTAVTALDARRQMLKTSGRCFNCLAKRHIGKKCRAKPQCQTCKRKHHPSICNQRVTDGAESLPDSSPPFINSGTGLNPGAQPYVLNHTTSNLCSTSTKSILLQTARARVYNPRIPELCADVRILFDSGSQRSYMTERAKMLLHLEPEYNQALSIATFGSTSGDPKMCPIVSMGIVLKGYPSTTMSLCVVPMICEPLTGQPIDVCVEQNSHLASLELADWADRDSKLEVDVLVGSDRYWELVTGTVYRNPPGPTAIHTKLGWVLAGPVSVKDPSKHHTNLVTTHILHVDTKPNPLNDQLRAFWELESLGVQPSETATQENPEGTIEFKNGRYEVSLPWKPFHPTLADNYRLSEKRLHGLLRRLRPNPTLLQDYDRIIREQIENGIVEDAPIVEPGSVNVHYLPHHAVVRSDKDTTKLCIVYDASAKVEENPSLNDCLFVGPKFNQRILDILLRFRSYRVALTSDIEKAFLMISVKENDRDALRFLWVNGLNEPETSIRLLRFTRVVFGVCSSPFLLNLTIRYHLEQYRDSHPELVQKLIDSFYVDDVVSGASTEEEAFEQYTDSKALLKDGSFNLRKFRTNSKTLQRRIEAAEFQSRNPQEHSSPYSDETYTGATLGVPHSSESPTVKVLGVIWDPETDYIHFDTTNVAVAAVTMEPTKRNVVSVVGRFYDPLEFLTPVVIQFKKLFQKLCEKGIEWDEILPSTLQKEWWALVKDLQDGNTVFLPRSYQAEIDEDECSYSLYGFCDASMTAYAAVVYLVIRTSTVTYTRFLVAKTRVAPLQTTTIPRLELLSALLLARLITTVSSALESTLPDLMVRCYTDSTVALYWIKGITKEWKPFVRNRVNEIRQKTPPDLWHHCAGVTNPADIPSRGTTMAELQTNYLWRNGPGWMKDRPTSVTPCNTYEMPEGCSSELKATEGKTHNLASIDVNPTISNVIDCHKYSTFRKLVRVTAYVIRAVTIFKDKKASQSSSLSTEELSDAERRWLEEAQKSLQGDNSFDKLRSQLNLFQDEDGLWRCGGRLANADIPYSTKYPILLPRSHTVTRLIVERAHKRVLHNGVRETLTEIRGRFWISKGRSLVRTVIHRCVICRRHEGAPFLSPPPPPLPVIRIKDAPAFSFTGVDFAGPLIIRSDCHTKTRKAWICLFTCLVVRAVHLDVVLDMSTETFIRCLKRFAARRGLPQRFLSDNGKTFKSASKFVKSIFKSNTVCDHFAEKGCEWSFNVEKAPWWGGAFERMVQSTKRCLRKMIGQASLTQDELLTAVTEIESIINSRPLSYVSSEDTEEPLTPSHLLIGRRVLNLPDSFEEPFDPRDKDFDVDSTQLTRRTKHLSNILNHFWKRWRNEYLAELRESHRQLLKNSRANLKYQWEIWWSSTKMDFLEVFGD